MTTAKSPLPAWAGQSQEGLPPGAPWELEATGDL